MLDTDTKRRIDTARDILVGKVPDPKSQVEQITIALIYKFMDDMDAEAEELGGKRKFFAGEFARYGWAKLLQKGLGGHEALALYSDGISRMPENPGVPPLFRDIFKNAYLPYRDPETLKAFLKIIDEFKYDHSERLGDAFEYLLSVLGSQGDAGQFRTPRHIIDFLVQVINPQKNETILDPACGTAGFLISAWKHIQAQNQRNGHSTLTPDERGRLALNIKGYDISPDMVRLSLANLYLHGFTDPHVVEYDTLTSEERWNEHADVILANPPFMSPKGGIKPHKRFSVQSKRSEVLFVDYMAEHLTPNGRAGIIVPEGIIFQSQGSYKELRKMLVENSLVAVISLPAGVFQPYSGVKTSILVLDRSIAKQSDSVAFFKVENDGFGLGSQRKAIVKDDLPTVHAEIAEYLRRLRARVSLEGFSPTTGQIVSKERIADNGDFNLSVDRYFVTADRIFEWPTSTLGALCELISGQHIDSEDYNSTGEGVPYLTGPSDFGSRYPVVSKWTPVPKVKALPGDILITVKGSGLGKVNQANQEVAISRQLMAVRPHSVDPSFLYVLLEGRYSYFQGLANGAAIPGITRNDVLGLEVPLPPLDVQKEIVAEIEGYQKIIDGARQVVDNYRPHIAIDPEWPVIELGSVCRIRSGGTPDRSNDDYWNGQIPWVTTTLIDYGLILQANEYITEAGLQNSSTWIVPKGTVLMAMYGQGITRGRVGILGIDAAINQACAAFIVDESQIQAKYLYRILQGRYEDLRAISEARGGNQSNLSAQLLKEYTIPLPPLDIQHSIVTEIEAEQALVDANKELIVRFEKKIQAALDRVWGSCQSAGEST